MTDSHDVAGKRRRTSASDGCDNGCDSATTSPAAAERPLKRPRIALTSCSQTMPPVPRPTPSLDHLSSLSDELLIRILGYLSMSNLLTMAPVSRRFHRIADDSQLWKALYYERFVLPRAMRIPGFRKGPLPTTDAGPTGGGFMRMAKLRVSDRRVTRSREHLSSSEVENTCNRDAFREAEQEEEARRYSWKRQYKLRHNWARGICAVEELSLGGNTDASREQGAAKGGLRGADRRGDESCRMLVKVVDGIAVTADRRWGLRVWELKTRTMVVSANLSGWKSSEEGMAPNLCDGSREADTEPLIPTSLAVDTTTTGLDIAVGLLDGSFGIWQLDVRQESLARRFIHAASSSGALVGIAYSHPFVLTATESVLISLYVFSGAASSSNAHSIWLPPSLLTSLRSHTSQQPIALSIRKLASITIASIAYTFSTRQGWSIGIQDLHVGTPETGHGSRKHAVLPQITTTRLAYSPPVGNGSVSTQSLEPNRASSPTTPASYTSHTSQPLRNAANSSPTTLCYTHPYLLATLPDNTLILHLCTSSSSTLDISPGIRLWGHTSGISDAEITSRGKAVSVSTRGDEMRVWELEGRPAAERGRSVAIRPSAGDIVVRDSIAGDVTGAYEDMGDGAGAYDWDERRNWVGFDDEMVIVLKESRGGGESLMVYDFS